MCIFCDIVNAQNQLHPEGERKQTQCEEVLNVITHVIGVVYFFLLLNSILSII